MKKLVAEIFLFSFCMLAYAGSIPQGKIELAGFEVEVWGDYEISHMIFPNIKGVGDKTQSFPFVTDPLILISV